MTPQAIGSAALLLAVAFPLDAQLLRGRALDAVSGEPLPAVRVTILNAGGRVLGRVESDTAGGFALELASPGRVRLLGERAGYLRSRSGQFFVAAGEEVDLELRMSSAPMTLDPVFVTARQGAARVRALELAGFYEREASGFGRFLHRDDIGAGRSANLGQVLRRQPGLDLYMARQGRQLVYFTRSQMGVSGAPCIPVIFVDGVKITYDDINHVVMPEDVAALEMYRSQGEMPPQFFSTEARCGLLLFWTRTRHDDAEP